MTPSLACQSWQVKEASRRFVHGMYLANRHKVSNSSLVPLQGARAPSFVTRRPSTNRSRTTLHSRSRSSLARVTATRTRVRTCRFAEGAEFRFWRGVRAAIPLVGWPWKIQAQRRLRSVLLTYVNWCTSPSRALGLKTFAMTSTCLASKSTISGGPG